MYLFGGGCSFLNGLSSHFCRSTFTNRFSLIKATRLDKYQLCFAFVFSAFNISIQEPEGHEFAQDDAGLVPWQEGDIRMIDIGRLHSLRNTGTEDRIHMIIHGQYSGKTVQDIIDSFRLESNKELDKQSK